MWEQIDGAQMGFSHQPSALCLPNTNHHELPALAAALVRGWDQRCCVRAVLINPLFLRIYPPKPSSEINEVSGLCQESSLAEITGISNTKLFQSQEGVAGVMVTWDN